ncbi:MAG: hypothetical protein H7A19_17595 [Rhodanobacteraceae bacterium]|nr:hypothetical protein [Rhodanobacteraceae bacterium]
MSFLDRLKREADQQRAQAEAVAREKEERDSRYLGQIEPRMKALTTYLEGLAETLREVKPPILVPLTMQGYGDLAGVPVWDYKVEHERRYRAFILSMGWTLRIDPERTPEVRAEGAGRIQTLTSLFRQHHLGGIKEIQRTPKGEASIAMFHARGHLKARMQAQITAEDPVLRMSFENVNWLGSSRRQVAWNEIDDGLFDRIARFIVREDDSLFTEELPEALRQKLGREPEPTRQPLPGEALAQASKPTPTATPRPAAPAATPAPPLPQAKAPPRPVEKARPSDDSERGTSIPGTIRAPAPIEPGEVIQIDESRLGLWGDPDAPVIGLDREGDFARQAKAAAAAAAKSAAPTVSAPAGPPVDSGGVIPIDESKLGLDQFVESEEFGAIARTLQPKPISAPPSPPVPPAAPASPAARSATTAPRTAAAPATPPTPAARPAAAAPTPASPAPAAPQQRERTAPLPPAAPAARPQPPVDPEAKQRAGNENKAPAAAAEGAESTDDDKEREAALFRLRMRAMMARLRSDEPDSDKSA